MKTQMNGQNQSQQNNQTQIQERTKEKTTWKEDTNEEIQVDNTMYKIVLLNNDDTSGQAVLDVLKGVFGHDDGLCADIMMDAHQNGSAMVWVDTQQNCTAKLREAQIYCGQLAGETVEGYTLDDGQNRPHYYQNLEFRIEDHQEET